MEPIPHEKKLEVAQYYILGLVYAEIEKKTGVSHGSVVNIIKDLEAGQLTIPGVATNELNDLHQLSSVLKKKGCNPSQALLGIALFERFTEAGVVPSKVDQWTKLVKVFSPDSFPAKDFFEAALRLHQLEEAEGKPFEVLGEEYANMKQKAGKLGSEVDSMDKKKEHLNEEVASLTLELKNLGIKRGELKASLEKESTELEEAKTAVAIAQEKSVQLNKDNEVLEKNKLELSLEVGGREESVKKLQNIGFPEEDLLRLRNLIEGMGKKDNVDPGLVKDRFFLALSRFGDLAGIEKATQEGVKVLEEQVKNKSIVAGEVAKLEGQRAVLQGEVSESAAAAAKQIQTASAEVVSSIRLEADTIKGEIKSILEDTLVAGMAISEMMAAKKEGEEAGKELKGLIGEVQRRLGGSQ